jgi:hypothetical protein
MVDPYHVRGFEYPEMQIAKAVAAERERCAEIVKTVGYQMKVSAYARLTIIAAICRGE